MSLAQLAKERTEPLLATALTFAATAEEELVEAEPVSVAVTVATSAPVAVAPVAEAEVAPDAQCQR